MSASGPQAESLSQRELRNESGRVLRVVSEGQSFVLTSRGGPVGRIVRLDGPAASLPIARTAMRLEVDAILTYDHRLAEAAAAAGLGVIAPGTQGASS